MGDETLGGGAEQEDGVGDGRAHVADEQQQPWQRTYSRGSALASPALLIPFAGELTEGGACVIGGILGGLGFGWLGNSAGRSTGEGLYKILNEVSEFSWSNG